MTKPTIYDVELTFTEPLLGATPFNLDVYKEFIQNQWRRDHPDEDPTEMEEELARLGPEDMEERGMTGFLREDGKPCLSSHVIKGFFKEACGMLRRVDGTLSKKVTAFKKIVDGLVFVEPRFLVLTLPEGAELTTCVRPLRAETARGPRVALACSEEAPIGTRVQFSVLVLGVVTEDLLTEWLEYGALHGLGQYRSHPYGSFTYTMTKRG